LQNPFRRGPAFLSIPNVYRDDIQGRKREKRHIVQKLDLHDNFLGHGCPAHCPDHEVAQDAVNLIARHDPFRPGKVPAGA
jgi:hypothetical protein